MNSGQSWSITWEFSDDADKQFSFFQSEVYYLDWDLTARSLTTLNLSNVGLSGDVPNGIDKLSNLENLILSRNKVTLIPTLESNTKLKNLDLSYNSLKNYAHSFPNSLTDIKLNNNSINDDIANFLSKITVQSLETLDLSDNKFSGEIPSSLLSSSSLTSLNLAYNDLAGSLPTIRDGAWTKLDISNNQLTGNFPEALTKSETSANAKCNLFSCERQVNFLNLLTFLICIALIVQLFSFIC